MRALLNRTALAAALLLTVALTAAASATSVAPKRVLLVFENEGFSPAALELQQGILPHLRKELGQNIEFFCDQMEATRFPEAQEQALSWIRARYATQSIDVVIFVGAVALDILPGVPTVYAGHTSFVLPKDPAGRRNKVTVSLRVDLKKTIAAARQLDPKANSILVIAGSGYEDHILLDEVRRQLHGSDLSVEYLADAAPDDLLLRVAHLPRETIVLPISYTHDLNGHIYSTSDVVGSLSRLSTAPIYTASDTLMGSGVVGGYVVDFDKTGAVIADIVVQALAGKTEAQIAVPPQDTSAYLFDWGQLQRWGFSERDLPRGSIVRYKPVSFWEQYRWRIVGIVALVLGQSLLILRLLVIQKERAIAEAALRDMTGRLLSSQDEERRRFARDLHDGTGQHLSGITLAISQVLARFPAGHDGLHKLLQESHSSSRQALNEMRTVSFVLHPPLLDGLGLVAAARWYLNGLQKRSNLEVEFEAPAEITHLGPDAEKALFRILQESMSNVLKRSGRDRIRVVLSSREDTVALEIEDDGDGMTPEQLVRAEGAAALGVGIAGMRERLRQLHGRLEIHSSASGTRVTAIVPIDKERYAAHSFGR